LTGYILDYMLHTIRNTAYDATMKSHDKLSLADLMVSHILSFSPELSAEGSSLLNGTRTRVFRFFSEEANRHDTPEYR
jgi:hypothetical protein